MALKIIQKQNLGLTFWQKILIQTFLALGFSGLLVWQGWHQSVSLLLSSMGLSHPVLFLLFATFLVVGTANATNLTDGLNGLLGFTALIVFLTFALLAGQQNRPEAVIIRLRNPCTRTRRRFLGW